MPDYTASNAQCTVFTFKEGLLSKVAHDLAIEVSDFRVSVDPVGPSVQAEFDAASLRVVAVMRDGNRNAEGLSASDKEKIAGLIASEVLHANKHPKIRFVSRHVTAEPAGGYRISGDLTLHGITREITLQTELQDGCQVAVVDIHQPDYGITPFKAMLGTLKVKPHVTVHLAVPQL